VGYKSGHLHGSGDLGNGAVYSSGQEVIALLDTSQDLQTCAAELGHDVGQLLTPLTRYTLQNPDLPWGIDNGAFSRFDERAFLSLLKREERRKEHCLFVTLPDVVGSARRTLEVFDRWKSRIGGWNIALVIQDGQQDLPVPWDDIAAIFIGGSTHFKLSNHAEHCIKAAQILGKWVHVGRVNDAGRWQHFEDLGVDSIDGTGLSRYSHMRESIMRKDFQKCLI
jgi:hypothetical protein